MPPEALVARLKALPGARSRHLVAVAGPPGAGKSTLADALVEAVGARAALVPMDGFHLDNAVLDARGLRPRKGAPETFDAAGFAAAVDRLAQGGEVVLPVFDRARDIAIAGARVIAPSQDIAVVEGNYLLFDEPPWRALARSWTLSVWLQVPDAVLETRLLARWTGLGLTAEDARIRAGANDLPNARRITAARLPADFTLDDSGGTDP